jgi:hypothetical protein
MLSLIPGLRYLIEFYIFILVFIKFFGLKTDTINISGLNDTLASFDKRAVIKQIVAD